MDILWDEELDMDELQETQEVFDLALWEEEAEASDEIPIDDEQLLALEQEWNGTEAEDDADGDWDEDRISEQETVPEDEDDPHAPISLAALRQQMEEVAVERIGQAARTETDFGVVISEMDRLDRNRERRERYHENLRGDVPLEYGAVFDGLIFPSALNSVTQQLLRHGSFLDILFDCPYEMHQLTADGFLSSIVEHLKEEHKEVLYFLSLRLYSTTKLAALRGQSDRNIRKLRDTYTRKLQRQLYQHLCHKENLSLREKEFLSLYSTSLEQQGVTAAKVKRENKTPKRKKATLDESKDG